MNAATIDPTFWDRWTVGNCTVCGAASTLIDGLCWDHRPERQDDKPVKGPDPLAELARIVEDGR